ncbi:acyltransferase family protein [Blastococcus sp. SYSU D00813]
MAIDTELSRPAAAPPEDPRLAGLPRDGGRHQRGDIEGLRALAVLLVIADHLFGVPHGGFVGVDVFFVISGFLITGLLLREHRERGRISFTDFYRRRIRRILPASLLVLAVTVGAAHVVFFGTRARATVEDALWSLLFAGNWHFALDGTDYQQAAGPVSPLQHYWSLSVEEQFYVAWPAVMAVALALAGWRRRHRVKGLKGITAITAVLVAGGYAWALHETAADPTWAYFSTFSRVWELGLGALLAVAVPAASRIPARLRPLLGWAGLAAIAVSVVVIDAGTPFPAPGALLPVLGTVAVIAAGTGGDSRLGVLTNPVSRHLGALSYSLYLWHFPAIVVLAALMPVDATYYALVLGVTAVGSVASYHLVEQPVRRSSWLLPGRPREPRSWRAGARLMAGVAAGLAAVLVAAQATGIGWPWSQDAGAQTPPPSAAAAADTEPGVDPQEALSAEISAALTATEWPELSPGLDALGTAAQAPEWIRDDCLNVLYTVDRCRYGDAQAERTAVLLGDSVAISWLPGIRAALGNGWRVQSLTLGQCPQVAVRTRAATGIEDFAEYCSEHQAWALGQVRQMQPDLVVVASAANSVDRLASEVEGEAARAEWREGLTTTLAGLDTTATRVVVLGSPPEGADLAECATRFNTPQDCVSSGREGHEELAAVERATIDGYEPVTAEFAYVDTEGWFCDAAGRCPSFVGSTPVYADGVHLTAAYSERLAPVLRAALLG